MAKSQCSDCGEWFEDSELDDHLNQHLDEPAGPTPESKGPKCPHCQTVMDAYYGVPFRIGGTGPMGRVLIGWWAELSEEPIPIDLYICPECGRMLTFASEKTRDRLKRAARHALFRRETDIKTKPKGVNSQ